MNRIESPRARRLRDRERMTARAARISAAWNDRPDDAHRECLWGRDDQGNPVIIGHGGLIYPDWEWRDLAGVVRHGHRSWDDVFAARALYARLHRDHLAHCSCKGCANPRRRGGSDRRTLSERRADEAARQAVEELAYTTHPAD